MKTKFAIALAMTLGTAIAVNAQTPTTTTTPATKNEVNNRLENQHDRIHQGVKSGELTHKEAKLLNSQEKGIHQQVATERAANGGKLTKGEKKQVNKEMNAESKNIYRKKHNAAHTAPKH